MPAERFERVACGGACGKKYERVLGETPPTNRAERDKPDGFFEGRMVSVRIDGQRAKYAKDDVVCSDACARTCHARLVDEVLALLNSCEAVAAAEIAMVEAVAAAPAPWKTPQNGRP